MLKIRKISTHTTCAQCDRSQMTITESAKGDMCSITRIGEEAFCECAYYAGWRFGY